MVSQVYADVKTAQLLHFQDTSVKLLQKNTAWLPDPNQHTHGEQAQVQRPGGLRTTSPTGKGAAGKAIRDWGLPRSSEKERIEGDTKTSAPSERTVIASKEGPRRGSEPAGQRTHAWESAGLSSRKLRCSGHTMHSSCRDWATGREAGRAQVPN